MQSPGATRHHVLHLLGSAQAENAGPARVVANLALGLDPQSYALHAWFLGDDGPLAEELRRGGVQVRVLGWSRSAADPIGAWGFAAALRRTRFSIVHQHIGGRLVRKIARRMTGAALAMHLHSRILETQATTPAVVKAADVDAVIAVSRAVAALFPSARVVHTGVPLAELPADENRRYTGQGPVIGTAGRLVQIKGMADLLQALALLHREFPELRLEIAGDGPLRGQLTRQAEELGIGRVVRFLGWRDDLVAALASWAIFALPSLEEGLGIVVLEAMAAGLPVVASAVGGVPEVVEDGRTGWLVPPAHPEAMAERLRALVIDPGLRRTMGAAGHERIRRHFSIAAMAAETAAIYDELLGSRDRAPRSNAS